MNKMTREYYQETMGPATGSVKPSQSNPGRRKVLFLCYRFPYPLIGGDRIKSYHLLEHLSSFADVDLIALNEWNTGFGEYLDHIRSMVHSVTVIPFSPMKASMRIAGSLFTRLPIEMAWYKVPEMQQAVDAALERTNYDMVFSFFTRTACYVSEYKGTKMLIAEDSRILADERASKSFELTPEYIVRRLDAAKLLRYEPETMKKFSVTSFVARPDEERVKAVDPSLRTAILTNGVDTEYFDYRDGSEREDALLFTGHLRIFHNTRMAHRIIKHIYPAIKEVYPNMKLWIVGNAAPKSVRKLVEKTEGAELFEGVKDMRPFYHKAKLFLHPQDVGAGIQNKLLESMATGCPIVTTAIGASGIDGIINGMHVFVSETDDEFIQTALRLLANTEERGWLARNSRTLIERRYKWSNIYQSLDDIIEGLIPDFFKVGDSLPATKKKKTN